MKWCFKEHVNNRKESIGMKSKFDKKNNDILNQMHKIDNCLELDVIYEMHRVNLVTMSSTFIENY